MTTTFADQVAHAQDIAINGYKNVIPFPYSHMRAVMVGATRGEIMTIGGRPGHGKTSFAMALGLEWLKMGFKVLFISKEMPAFRLVHKMVPAESKILTSSMLRKGTLTEEQILELDKVSKDIIRKYSSLLVIADNKYNINDVPDMVELHRPDIIIDDYLQITEMDQNNERQELKRITLRMKRIAVEHMVAYVALSQLNRAIEIRETPYPITSDLAGSDAIGWNSADVLMIHYGHKLDPNKYPKDRISVIATKARYGETRAFHFKFDGDHMKFEPLIKKVGL